MASSPRETASTKKPWSSNPWTRTARRPGSSSATRIRTVRPSPLESWSFEDTGEPGCACLAQAMPGTLRLDDTRPPWRRSGRDAGPPVQFALVSDAAPVMSTWILTGMSGAGKTTAPRARPAVAVVDARRGGELAAFESPPGVVVILLDASDAVLVRRLADSSRPHPCSTAGAGQAAVAAERELLVPLRAAADVVIDTGALSDIELGERVIELVAPGHGGATGLRCTVSSFGFKYGPQAEADWVIDSRILPNPFWEPALRPLTGLDEPVRTFLLDHPETSQLIDRSAGLLAWVIDQAGRRGRRALHVAVGCTGGRHRSVVVATELAGRLAAGGASVDVRHRDVHPPDPPRRAPPDSRGRPLPRQWSPSWRRTFLRCRIAGPPCSRA